MQGAGACSYISNQPHRGSSPITAFSISCGEEKVILEVTMKRLGRRLYKGW